MSMLLLFCKKTVAAVVGTFYILTEGSDKVLAEDGSFILRE